MTRTARRRSFAETTDSKRSTEVDPRPRAARRAGAEGRPIRLASVAMFLALAACGPRGEDAGVDSAAPSQHDIDSEGSNRSRPAARTTTGFTATFSDSLEAEEDVERAAFCRTPAGDEKSGEYLRLAFAGERVVVLLAGSVRRGERGYVTRGGNRGWSGRIVARERGSDPASWKRFEGDAVSVVLTEVTPQYIRGTFSVRAHSPESADHTEAEGSFQAIPDATCGG